MVFSILPVLKICLMTFLTLCGIWCVERYLRSSQRDRYLNTFVNGKWLFYFPGFYISCTSRVGGALGPARGKRQIRKRYDGRNFGDGDHMVPHRTSHGKVWMGISLLRTSCLDASLVFLLVVPRGWHAVRTSQDNRSWKELHIRRIRRQGQEIKGEIMFAITLSC